MGDKIFEPKPFRGTLSEDPREWIQRTESWLSYNNYANWPNLENVTDEEERKSIRTAMAVAKRKVPYILELLLLESAGSWLSRLTMEEKETFETFKQRFSERYLEDRVTRHRLIVNVWEEKQKLNESVDDYYDSHVKLVKLAGLTADANTNQAFVHGLLPHIKMQVIMQDKVELKDLLEAARLAEIAFRETGETPLAATTITETTKREVNNEQEITSDNQTIKVLMELLESVVKATIQKTASTTFTAPPIIRKSTAVQVIEQQPEPDQGRQQGKAQNWIGQSRDTLQRRRQQSWHPQQQPQPQQQHSWQPYQQQPQPYRQQQQNEQPRQQTQSCLRQQNWQPRQESYAQQSQQNWQARERSQQYGQPRQQPLEDSCRYCGCFHLPGRTNCRMVQKACYTCGKLGHSYRVCRSTNGQQQTRQYRQPRTSRGWQPSQQQQQDRPTPHFSDRIDSEQTGTEHTERRIHYLNSMYENNDVSQRRRGQKLHEERIVKKNRIFVKIRHQTMLALIDTGSDVSLIREDVARSMNLKWRSESGDFATFCTANEGVMKNLGTIVCDIKIGGLGLGAKLNVVSGLLNPLILGIDFLRDNGGNVSIPEGIVEFYDYTVQVAIIRGKLSEALKQKQFVRCIEKVTIPPKTEQIVWTRAGREYQTTGTTLIEHCTSLDEYGLQLAKCLVNDCKETIPCKIFNYTDNVVELQPGTKIGVIEKEIVTPEVNMVRNEARSAVKQWSTHVKKFIAGVGQKTAQEIVDDMGIKLDRSRMTDEEYRLLVECLADNIDVFAKDIYQLKDCSVLEHEIELKDETPIACKQYPLTPQERQEATRQVSEMMDAGILEPSDSPFSFPVIMVKKKDGSMRLVCDLRRLNAQTVYQAGPPHITIDDLQLTLGSKGAKIISSIDLRSGYNQLVMKESDRQYCTIKLPGTVPVRFRRIPTGLIGAAATFQKVMKIILSGLSLEICCCYLDEILIFSHNMQEHRQHLQVIFDRLRSAGLMLHPEKCDFAKTEIKFLDYIISPNSIKIDPMKTAKITNYPRPTSVKEARNFYNLAHYFRRHCPRFSEVMLPIQELLRKDRTTTFRWGQEQENAFIKIKEILTNPPVLMLPDFTKTFYLCTDASEKAISAILCQKGENGALHATNYACRNLSKNEIEGHAIHLKECLAVLFGLQCFDGFLRDKPFIIRTDSRAITFMNKNEIMSSKLARWAVIIQSYPYTLEHVPAEQNGGPDSLSRLPTYEDEPNAAEELEEFLDRKILKVASRERGKNVQKATITFEDGNSGGLYEGETEREHQGFSTNELADWETGSNSPQVKMDWVIPRDIQEIQEREDLFQLQKEDADFKDMIRYKETGELPQVESQARKILYTEDMFVIENQRLHRTRTPRNRRVAEAKGIVPTLCIPACLRKDLITRLHNHNLHVGSNLLTLKLQERYFWPEIWKDAKEICSKCDICMRAKNATNIKKGEIASFPITRPMECLQIDHTGVLPLTENGNRYIVMIIDCFTKFVKLYPVKTMESEEVINCLLDWFATFGVARTIMSDNNLSFIPELTEKMTNMFKVKSILTGPHCHREAGLIESINERIKLAFQTSLTEATKWDTIIPMIEMSLRSTPNEATGTSPHEMLFGFDSRHQSSIDWDLSRAVLEDEGTDNRLKGIAHGLELLKTTVKENIETSKTKAQKKCLQEQLNETITQTDKQSDREIQRPTKVPDVQDQPKDVIKILGRHGKGYRVEMKDGTERIVKPEMVPPALKSEYNQQTAGRTRPILPRRTKQTMRN